MVDISTITAEELKEHYNDFLRINLSEYVKDLSKYQDSGSELNYNTKFHVTVLEWMEWFLITQVEKALGSISFHSGQVKKVMTPEILSKLDEVQRNMFLHAPPGTGKTSIELAVISFLMQYVNGWEIGFVTFSEMVFINFFNRLLNILESDWFQDLTGLRIVKCNQSERLVKLSNGSTFQGFILTGKLPNGIRKDCFVCDDTQNDEVTRSVKLRDRVAKAFDSLSNRAYPWTTYLIINQLQNERDIMIERASILEKTFKAIGKKGFIRLNFPIYFLEDMVIPLPRKKGEQTTRCIKFAKGEALVEHKSRETWLKELGIKVTRPAEIATMYFGLNASDNSRMFSEKFWAYYDYTKENVNNILADKPTILISTDFAYSSGSSSDTTVIMVFASKYNTLILVDWYCGRAEPTETLKITEGLILKYTQRRDAFPRVNFIMEDISANKLIYSHITNISHPPTHYTKMKRKDSKIERAKSHGWKLYQQLDTLEQGKAQDCLLNFPHPDSIQDYRSNMMLRDILEQLLAYNLDGTSTRNDDAVDVLTDVLAMV